MIAKTASATLLGFKPILVQVEVESVRGIPNLVMIGLPNRAVLEARERIRSALLSCGLKLKSKRIIVNLAPADVKKTSSHLELAIAACLLKNHYQTEFNLKGCFFLGELSLDGSIKPVRGALPLALAARQFGFSKLFLPRANLAEVSLIDDLEFYPVDHLKQIIKLIKTGQKPAQAAPQKEKLSKVEHRQAAIGFDQIQGQQIAKRALTISAAGNHHLLMVGPPGSGKSVLAKSLVELLPRLSKSEMIEVTKIYSILGLNQHQLISHSPFRNPHHSSSKTSILGGGSQLKPGEISLAHCGILFLDELSQFSRDTIESMRQPLEDKKINLSRVIGSTTYPADFTLVASTNPCGCGFYGSSKKACTCTPYSRQQYLQKISKPVKDRIDLTIWVESVAAAGLSPNNNSNSKLTLKKCREQVNIARIIQKQRWSKLGISYNSQLTSSQVQEFISLRQPVKKMLCQASDRLSFSTRAYFQLIKVARTIADLDVSREIGTNHLAEAISFRQL